MGIKGLGIRVGGLGMEGAWAKSGLRVEMPGTLN